MLRVQKVSWIINFNLINDATLLWLGAEAMWNCGLCDKTLDEWEELSKSTQTWYVFQDYFFNAEEKFNIERIIYDKNESLKHVKAESYEENDKAPEED